MAAEIFDLLRKGPKTAEEVALLAKVSTKTAYKNLFRLVDEGKVRAYPMLDGHRWHSLFALPDQTDLAASMTGFVPIGQTAGVEARVLQAIENLRPRLLREPDVDEILAELGEDPEDTLARRGVFRVASKARWAPPDEREKEEAQVRLQRVLRVAAWLKKGRLQVDQASGMSKDEIDRAKRYLEMFPERVPG